MIAISVKKLAAVVGGCVGDVSTVARGVCIDSRSVTEGDVFFAIAGENFDGHEYVEQAFAAGAVCAVCSRDVECGDNVIVKVDDTVKALGRLANFCRNDSKFKVVAITGSVGKTTVRQIACHVLSKHFKCHQAEKSFNNNIGLPLTLLGASDGCEIVLAEIGTNNPGEIAELTAIAEPDIAVVNNIFPAHLAGLGSIEGIIAEKASIAEGLKGGGKLLINGDFAGLAQYCQKSGFDFVSFGTDAGCDIKAEKLVSDGFSGSVSIEGVDVFVPLGGIGNLHNAIAAWAICLEFGISAEQFAEAVKTLSPLSMRMDVKEFGAVTVIDDCYNANPASMKNAVEFLMSLAGEQKKRSVFVCGDMAELGDESDRLHTELGEVIAEAKVKIVLVTGRQADRVAKAIRRSGGDAEVFAFVSTDELCENIINYVRTDDIILVKGSRSGQLEVAVERIAKIFS
ncbi:MAG: UDP-N-acetylmuramoyl-tripeptide--D-alanyl-D-alanine ligase [Planctomycetes bacterium]|nr:UDP-N-acetylmuramoyl-tripeptide--D-alanyl-D-alanine ligase [Planctomycetota bacterium]